MPNAWLLCTITLDTSRGPEWERCVPLTTKTKFPQNWQCGGGTSGVAATRLQIIRKWIFLVHLSLRPDISPPHTCMGWSASSPRQRTVRTDCQEPVGAGPWVASSRPRTTLTNAIARNHMGPFKIIPMK